MDLHIQDEDFHEALLWFFDGFGSSLLVDHGDHVVATTSVFMTEAQTSEETNGPTEGRAVAGGGPVADLRIHRLSQSRVSSFMTEISGRREGSDATAENIQWSGGDTARLS